MEKFLLRLVINAAAVAATAAILPGIHVKNNDIGTLLIIALIFGLVNVFIKPVIVILSCPLVLLTLGLYMLLINGVMLLITEAVAGDRFRIDGFWWAVLGGIVLGLISGILEGLLTSDKDKDEEEPVVVIRS